jgi:hypothetical protein
VRECAACGGRVEQAHRFCPWCAAPQRRKLVEFFRGHQGVDDSADQALRVSQYLDADVPGGHVRVSIWDESATVAAAVSINRREAERLARFLLPGDRAGVQPRSRAEHLLDAVRRHVRA